MNASAFLAVPCLIQGPMGHTRPSRRSGWTHAKGENQAASRQSYR